MALDRSWTFLLAFGTELFQPLLPFNSKERERLFAELRRILGSHPEASSNWKYRSFVFKE
jgi:hypothetical protein